MKRVFFYLLILICVSCKGELEVVLAKRQTIIPGIKTAKIYFKYNIQLKNITTEIKKIDSIVVHENNKCYQMNFALKKKNDPTLITEISNVGLYIITASLKESNYKEVDCVINKKGLTVYYTERNQQKYFTIDSFVEERKTKR